MKSKVMKCGIGVGIYFLLMLVILFLFDCYLHSAFAKKYYSYVQIEDTDLSLYIFPNTYGELVGYLVCEGETLEDLKSCEVFIETEKGEKSHENVLMRTRIDEPFLSVAGREILQGKKFGLISEWMILEENNEVTVKWNEAMQRKSATVSLTYDKMNPYKIYRDIRYYLAFGWILP